MNIEETREAIAATCSEALPGTAKVFPYVPDLIKDGTGFLVRGDINSEDVTFGELRVAFDLVIAVGKVESYAQKAADQYAVALWNSLAVELGMRNVVITTEVFSIIGQSTHCLVASFSTEVEAS